VASGSSTSKAPAATTLASRSLITPRELRHSFVSLLSDGGVPIEKIARLVGHSSTSTTERVYRHQIRPVVQGGAEVMDRLFVKPDNPDA
jgi:integrase